MALQMRKDQPLREDQRKELFPSLHSPIKNGFATKCDQIRESFLLTAKFLSCVGVLAEVAKSATMTAAHKFAPFCFIERHINCQTGSIPKPTSELEPNSDGDMHRPTEYIEDSIPSNDNRYCKH